MKERKVLQKVGKSFKYNIIRKYVIRGEYGVEVVSERGMLLKLFREDFVVGTDRTIGAESSRRRRNRVDGVPISLSIKLK